MQSARNVQNFGRTSSLHLQRRRVSALKIEVALFSAKLINFYQITQCCILLDIFHGHQHENLKLTLYYFIILEVGHRIFLLSLNASYAY